MNLEGFKWDTQLGDTSSLASFALLLPRSEWKALAAMAEALSAELTLLEASIAERRELWRHLGLPRSLLNELRRDEPWTPAAARVVRYDFHPTPEGYRISEVNSDVPGGFTEASTFTARLAAATGFDAAGDPLGELSSSLARACIDSSVIALLTAPGYTEDLQLVHSVAARLKSMGIRTFIGRPEQLSWDAGRAFVESDAGKVSIGAIYRFFQGEWLMDVPVEKWRPMLRGGRTPVCNPGVSLLTESKRLPLIWSELGVTMPTWSRLLPETRSVPSSLGAVSHDWVLKPAYCNTGDAIFGASSTATRGYWLAAITAFARSGSWVAQRRFRSAPVVTPLGPMHTCLGVYTVDGRATGVYARLSAAPVIDYEAHDVAVLLRD